MKRAPEQLSLDPGPGARAIDARDQAARRPPIETGRNRLIAVGAMFAIVFALLAGRLAHITIMKGEGGPLLARSSTSARAVEERADIVDRNGVLLATNLGTASLYADPKVVLDTREAAMKLSRVFPELGYDMLLAKLESKRRFVWIKRNLAPRQQYLVNSLGLPGLSFQSEQRRIYPQGRMMGHVLGFTGVDNHGLAGIEKSFEDRLGSQRRVIAGALELSLDVRVQHALREELAQAVTAFNAQGGAGIVLDARNGEVLALVSLPDFEPGRIGESDDNARFNRATLGVYELGSVFKTFTVALGLDSGTVNLADGYDASKPIRVARFVIRDFHAKKRWLSVPEIFLYSSNIGAAKMALDVGAAAQRDFLKRLGLLRRVDVELPEIGQPLYPSRWRDVSTMTIAFGHGIAVSPLQLASAVSAIVNGGVLMPPTVVKREAGAEVSGQRVISARTSATMRRLLRLVVARGTGKKAAVDGYLVGGKTGTAEKAGAGGYLSKTLVSSFVGAFPMTAPRYVVFALLDEPKGTEATYGFAGGGWTAAPVVGAVITRIAPILGVEPVDERAPQVRRALDVFVKGGRAKLASF